MGKLSYQVETRRVEQLFEAPSTHFEVPDFQRRYAWGREEVGALLDDLYGDDDWWTASEDEDPYFLGSIVLAGERPCRVLDGQQRLATLSLILAALRMRLTPHDASSSHKLWAYLTAGGFRRQEDLKLRLQPDDRALFERLLKHPDVAAAPEHRREPLCRAMVTILEYVDDCARRGRERRLSDLDVLHRIAARLLDGVELVQITAPSEADAFRLFETLNDRGLPLNASDLIKNKLFAQAGSSHLETVKASWNQIQDRTGPSEILAFLRHYWAAFHEPVRKDRLYDRYGEHLQRLSPREIVAFVQELEASAEVYGRVAHPRRDDCPWGDDAADVLRRLVDLRARSCRPLFLLAALSAPNDMLWLFRTAEAAQVRHTVIGNHYPAELEKAFVQVCRRVRDQGDELRKAVIESLDRLVPDDASFGAAFAEQRVVQVSGKWRAILVRLNDELSAGEADVAGPTRVHVEHILPRNPSDTGLRESGLEFLEADDLATHIGNLTLLSGSKNIAISNQPFSQKHGAFVTSDLPINRHVANCTAWGAAEIRERDALLAELAVRAWNWPGQGRTVATPSSLPPHPEGAGPSATGASNNGVLARFAGQPSLLGTVWVPRILWALEWMRLRGEDDSGANASTIAQVFSENHEPDVAPPNVARAFRQHGAELMLQRMVEEVSPLHYRILKSGSTAVGELLQEPSSDAPK